MLLPPVAITVRKFFADWVFMWLLAFAVFFGCKWLTWRRADRSSVSRMRSLAYLLAWPGMDAPEFLAKTTLEKVRLADWIRATGKTVLGAGLLVFAANNVTRSRLLAGWAGMAGVVLILHFGAFCLLSLTYRAGGIAAKPLMRSPGRAVSLSDFWANRWNTGFNKLAHSLLFLPLARRAGGAWATFFVFIASGLVHDLAISLPARGGYGLPTGYFALQGMAVLLEKSRAGAAFGLGRGWRGWLFMIVVTASPAPILFHSAFVNNVVLPMLQAIGRILGTS